jgi:hypothetical protein
MSSGATCCETGTFAPSEASFRVPLDAYDVIWLEPIRV